MTTYATIPYAGHWNWRRGDHQKPIDKICSKCLEKWEDNQLSMELSAKLVKEKNLKVFGWDINLEPEVMRIINMKIIMITEAITFFEEE